MTKGEIVEFADEIAEWLAASTRILVDHFVDERLQRELEPNGDCDEQPDD